MLLKVLMICICGGTLTSGSPIIYNQQYNGNHPPRHLHQNAYPPNIARGYLTPPRAITTLNTFVPRALIPPAPPRNNIPRVYETPKPRMYTAPPIFRTITPAPPTKKSPYVNNKSHTHSHNSINPKYAYSYSVNDNRTGDHKKAEERLENGVVRGSYSLLEADGTTLRRVTYTADDVNGFVANVEQTNQAGPLPANNNVAAKNKAPFTIFNP